MKVVAINGSPNKHGNTYHALSMVGAKLNEQGIDFEILHIGNKALPISPPLARLCELCSCFALLIVICLFARRQFLTSPSLSLLFSTTNWLLIERHVTQTQHHQPNKCDKVELKAKPDCG